MRLQNREFVQCQLFLCCLVAAVLLQRFGEGTDVALTLHVDAGSVDCFHQPMVEGVDYEVEYQVIPR